MMTIETIYVFSCTLILLKGIIGGAGRKLMTSWFLLGAASSSDGHALLSVTESVCPGGLDLLRAVLSTDDAAPAGSGWEMGSGNEGKGAEGMRAIR
jgi:hypothetical protein